MIVSDSESIKALYVLPNLNVSNGISSVAMNYLRQFDHSRIVVDFATYSETDSPYLEEIAEYGGKVFVLPSVWNIGRHYANCREILRNGHYHIIHDNIITKSLPLMICAKREGVPVRVLHAHSGRLSSRHYKECLQKIGLELVKRQCNNFFACSIKAAECHFPNQSYMLIPNFINSVEFEYHAETRATVRNRFHVKEDALVIGTVARMAVEKNLYFALDVIKALLANGTPVEYWLVGRGPLLESLKHYAETLQIQNSVRFWGERDDVTALYHAMDALFLPSLFEGLPVTVVEAQAMGLPCVISDAITTEVAYTDLLRFIPLASGLDVWADALSQCMQARNSRRSYAEELSASPFSEQAGKTLYKTYLRLLGGA